MGRRQAIAVYSGATPAYGEMGSGAHYSREWKTRPVGGLGWK